MGLDSSGCIHGKCVVEWFLADRGPAQGTGRPRQPV